MSAPRPAPLQLSKNTLGVLCVAAGAALFGTLSYIARQAAATGMESLPFVAWRGTIGALLGGGLLWIFRLGVPRACKRARGVRDGEAALAFHRDLGRGLSFAAAGGGLAPAFSHVGSLVGCYVVMDER